MAKVHFDRGFYLPHKALPLASREVFRQNGTKVALERLLGELGKLMDLAMIKIGLCLSIKVALALLTVSDDIFNRKDRHIVCRSKLLNLWHTCHRAILIG